ncbi:MAG TPA: hypothetical protein VJN21_10975 [Candidatus Acidoferrales bacterium]|nr:hypothetical protein [Candidatus Acidoferrales bacterium]
MRLSIFNSKSPAGAYAKILIAICAIVVIGLEMTSDYLLKHNSPTYARISRQYAAALKVRPAAPGEPPSVIMVGNSLLLHGVEVDRLRGLTGSEMRIYPIFLEATGYYDWLYGLRRLFDRGAKPDVVILGVGVSYFLKNSVREDYTPMVFFDLGDAWAAASDMHLDRTEASNLLLAHSSIFWDTRSSIRTQVLNHAIPHLQDLFALINQRPAIPDGKQFDAVAIPRLRRLRALCDANGVKLILLVPPTLLPGNSIDEMAVAARATGVDVSVPIDPRMLSAKDFELDGMHLNAEGAILFTAALARDLQGLIVTPNTTASRQRLQPSDESSAANKGLQN